MVIYIMYSTGGDIIKNILLGIEDENIVFSYLENNNDTTSIGKLVFTYDNYINYKKELILRIKKIIKKNIKNCIINNKELSKIALEITKEFSEIYNILFNFNEGIDYDTYEMLLKDDSLKYINCYDIDYYMFNELNKKNIKIETRSKINFTSNILTKNDIYTFSDIYYKKDLKIDSYDIYNDKKDLNLFFKENFALENINIYKLTLEEINKIIDLIKANNIHNIKINIIINDTTFNYIRKHFKNIKTLKKDILKTNEIELNLNYSGLYKKHYSSTFMAKKNLQMAIVLIVIINLSIIGIFGYTSYKTLLEAENSQGILLTEINNNVDDTDLDEIENFSSSYIVSNGQERQVKDFKKLLATNDETVGWLKVNNTKVDYSVVQHSDNSFYINKNFYKNNSPYGWIFMDFRNHVEFLDQNTIIYGHNITIKDIMFGSLRKTLEEEWYTNRSNQVIHFDTIYKNMNWQIFSIYTAEPTFNYLQTNYYDDGTNFTNFLNEVKKRSIYDFGVEVNNTDNILTLSTCHQYGTKRLVIHAKLIK